ncbi:uncharacterized protein C12orf42 homolog [Neophocaena asiaeorientalis asiaeorientalis]|uniref:Uncharacterized protein C12orf42 homolog n=1 Tax=Neophocaena asiaeorientalis asiaeorientalis TaxID=1706337 RepID=A0A341AB31_NEOAA|nr:uncharacterized protein C12orf42 homolog [Neophocaena asiaeorientalis asiaeorientalis]
MCLPYTVFPERIQTPVTYRRLLCALQSSIPRPPAVSIASFDKESHREANPSPTPSSEWEETPLIFTVRQEMNMGARGSPRQAWGSSFLEQEMTKMPIQVHSVNPVHLEAIGTHINRHLRFQSQPPCNSKGDSVPSGLTLRLYTAVGLSGRSQTPFASSRVSWSLSELELEERMTPAVGAPANPDSQSWLLGAFGNSVGRGTVAMAPEMLPRHPHPPGKRGPGADASLPGGLAGASLPVLACGPTHLPSKRLTKVCSSLPSRQPLRFHTVCSQAPPRPGVNAHLH